MKIMTALELKIPPPLLLIIFAALTYGVNILFPFATFNYLSNHAYLRIGISTSLLVIGLCFALTAIYRFKKAKTTVNPLKPNLTSSLVNSGIYNITRNPMYVGLFCVLMAWAILLANMLTWLVPFVFALYISRFQIIPEERALEKRFGDVFMIYKKNVRRWL